MGRHHKKVNDTVRFQRYKTFPEVDFEKEKIKLERWLDKVFGKGKWGVKQS